MFLVCFYRWIDEIARWLQPHHKRDNSDGSFMYSFASIQFSLANIFDIRNGFHYRGISTGLSLMA